MSVWYLELDDEITDAVARLRAAKDDRVVFVVPAGSRIGTGRINFRLLAREAVSRDLRIALVSGDPQVRALAASAGLPTYPSVGESERGAATEGPLALDGTEPPSEEGTDATATITTAPGPGAGVRTAGSRPVRRPRSRRQKAAMTAGALGLAVVVGGGTLYALYRGVPTAQITLALAPRALGPQTLRLTVSASEPTDAARGMVQGQLHEVTASGSEVVTATERVDLNGNALGTVTFTNAGSVPVPIPQGTIVATPDGIEFRTLGVVSPIPVGGTADMFVQAVEVGPRGNVEANAISVIRDGSIAAQLGAEGGVVNAAPTQGGQTGDQMKISQQDYDDAVARLEARLVAALPTTDATDLPPGTIAFPATAQRAGDIRVVEPEGSIVGAVVPEATITGSLGGRMLTVAEASVMDVARQLLAAAALPDSLVPDPTIDLGSPTVADGRATFDASGAGVVYGLPVTVDELREQVRSKTIPEAQRILDAYGTATITLSPDFLPALPDDPSRIEITPEAPAPGATPIPMTSPSPSPAPGASASPQASGMPAPGASGRPDATQVPAA
jgi:hypothetical protein